MTKIRSSTTLLLPNVKFNYKLADVMCYRMIVDFKRIKEMCDLLYYQRGAFEVAK